MAHIQIGVEVVKDGKRTVRVTPIDSTFAIADGAWVIIKAFFGLIDSTDIQPGDGEVDIKLTPKLLEALEKAVPAIKLLELPKDANLFLRAK